MNLRIIDVYPAKAQFAAGEDLLVWIELSNSEERQATISLVADLVREETIMSTFVVEVSLHARGSERVLVRFPASHAEYEGYGVDVRLLSIDESSILYEYSGALDVVSDWRKSIRYGFLSDFRQEDSEDRSDMDMLNKFHINLVQFYDWMYRHDQLLPPPEEQQFTDLMGRTVHLDAVRAKIAQCHDYGMRAMAYGAVYAAGKTFYEEHPEWGLYNSAGQGIDFIGIFHIMNIAAESPWRGHLIEHYRDAVERLDFDGIHMDTYGFPKTAFSRLGGQSELIRLDEHFPSLIAQTREGLKGSKEDVCLIFNNVGNWPVHATGPAPQEAIYVEVWAPYTRYHHIRQIIDGAKLHGGGKPVILAAYLAPFRELQPESAERAEAAALLLTAAIVSGGATHLLVGEHHGVLTQGYYVDYSRMRESFVRELRTYYDFMVRYGHLHYDNELIDVSMTHTEGDNLEYRFEGFDYSTWGEPGKVWVTMKEKDGLVIIHLINLTGCSDDLWNEGKDKPRAIERPVVRMQIDRDIHSVYSASPDSEMGRARRPDYRIERGERGYELIVELPRLLIWTMLVVKYSNVNLNEQML